MGALANIDLSFLASSRVAVLGLGRSGMAVARALVASGIKMLAWDDSEAVRADARMRNIEPIDLHAADWSKIDLLVLSPGIPHTHPAPHALAERARAAGCPIVSDVDLLARAQRAARYVGVTGTNGKSTTTSLIGHILERAGRAVATGGNIGVPALSLAPLAAGGTYVLEMSSYQLELIPSLVFDIAVLLNISPDHLDRHSGFEGYVAAKKRLFEGQDHHHVAVIGVDDSDSTNMREALSKCPAGPRIVPVSGYGPAPGGIYAQDGMLRDDGDGRDEIVVDLRRLAALPGRHNWQNVAAAYAVARAENVDRPTIVAALESFPGLGHRQERIATVDGVTYINDSKATNGDAAARAIATYDAIYWIAGGLAKEGGLEAVAPEFPRILHAFLIGKAAGEFARRLDGHVAYTICGTLEHAVEAAFGHAARERSPGVVVLLSPACASFDQFSNFEARGDAFRDLVAGLPGARLEGARP
jgi:UDP-N-acetylmuramoylalanine--D-glutamate ligase